MTTAWKLIAAAAIAMAAAPGSAAATQDRTAVSRDAEAADRGLDIVRRGFERWAAGGTGFFDEILAPDVRWTIRGSGPAARTYVGRDAFMREAVTPFAARLASPIMPRMRHLAARDDVVIAVWDGETTARDGVPYANSYVWVFRMEDGQAAEVEAYLDLVPYYDVLRRVPLPEAAEAR